MVSRQELHQFASGTFIHRLLRIFHSADRAEQKAAEMLAVAIFERVDIVQLEFFHESLRLIETFSAGLCPYLCMSPALRVCIRYLRFRGDETIAAYQHLFHTTFLPLFSRDHLEDFARPLSDTCLLYYRNDEQLAIVGLRYLLGHWPITNSAKVVAFLGHAGAIITVFNRSGWERLLERFLGYVRFAIRSPNSNVTLAALELMGHAKILDIFRSELSELLDAIGELEDHWHNVVRQLAKIAAGKVAQEEILASTREPIPTDDVRGRWADIARMAGCDAVGADFARGLDALE
jgi:hypothetical protein